MISYHASAGAETDPRNLAQGFLVANVLAPSRLSRCVAERVWSPIVWAGGTRASKNFAQSRLCALDFDGGETLAQALKIFCDCIHIIGTTKSHQHVKNGILACDRFRVIIPWTETIVSLRDYQYNIAKQIKKYGADEACKDGARFYFPCKEIVSVQEEGFTIDVEPAPPLEQDQKDYAKYLADRQQLFRLNGGRMPGHVRDFLRRGKTFGQGRQQACYVAAIHLFEMGFGARDIASMIAQAPFSRDDFKDYEIEQAVNSALKNVQGRLPR